MTRPPFPLRARRSVYARAVVALTFAACLFALAPAARAVEIQVEILTDSLAQPPAPLSNVYTLRKAVNNASDNSAPYPQCQAGEAGPAVDSIVFNLPGMIAFALAGANKEGDGGDAGALEAHGDCATGVPAPPDALDDDAAVDEDSGPNAVAVLVNDTDANGDALTIIAVTQGANGGTVAITGGGTGVSYTPAPDYYGPDSFTYTVADGVTGNDTATVAVNVANVNDPPVANNDNYSMDQDRTLTVPPPTGLLANDTDIDGPVQTVVLDSGPSNAASFGLNADGSFSYMPDAGFTGVDTFEYHVSDGTDDSNVATITINVDDTQFPVLTCSVAAALLWSPNHDLVNIGLSVSATDNDGEEPEVEIEVFSDEDDTEQPEGMSPDAKDVAAETLRLRAERRDDADGRVYVIRIKATDTSNNVSYSYCTVVVPHGQGRASLSDVNAQAAEAVVTFVANENNPPAGFFLVGDGPAVGPKQ